MLIELGVQVGSVGSFVGLASGLLRSMLAPGISQQCSGIKLAAMFLL